MFKQQNMIKKLLLVVIVVGAIYPSAHATIRFSDTVSSGQTLYFEIENIYSTYATVVRPSLSWFGYTKPTGALVIPSTITYMGNTYPVTRLGSSAFSNCENLTSLVLPSSVTKLEQYAFSQCAGLKSVDLGGMVDTIGLAAFGWCDSLLNVTGMESLRSIGNAIFRDCKSMRTITLPPHLTVITNNMFGYCYSLETVVLPDSLVTIEQHAFQECFALKTVVVPDRVRIIKGYAFQFCSSLKNVYLGNSLDTIGQYAFNGCSSLTSITLPASLSRIQSVAFTGNSLDTIIVRATTPPTLASTAFYGRYNTAHVFVPCEALADYQADAQWSRFTSLGCGIVADVRPSNPILGQTTGGGVYDTITDITLTAIPAFGSMFYGWNNGVHDNPYTLHLTADTSVTALFYPVDSNTVITVHDTITNNYHDTTFVTEYIHDTTYVPVHDTTVVTEYIHDTTTVYVEVHDTLWLIEYIHDTVYIHDTIVVGVDEVDAINAKVYSCNGQIVVEGADGNTVTLYDLSGRYLATKQDYGTAIRFDVPISGTYMIKIGSHPARKVVVIRMR